MTWLPKVARTRGHSNKAKRPDDVISRILYRGCTNGKIRLELIGHLGKMLTPKIKKGVGGSLLKNKPGGKGLTVADVK